MSDLFRLEGRTALVTGASRGIGRAIALELARGGARVCVHYQSRREAAAQVVHEIEALGAGRPGAPASIAVAAELTRPEECRLLADACRDGLGAPDIVVHNAGIWTEMPIDATTPEQLDAMLDLNLKALFHLTAAVVPGMKQRRYGRIITIGSTAGLMGEPEHSHYAASKGGLEAFTRSLAVELGPYGITANSVAPGWTVTEMTAAELANGGEAAMAAEIPTRRLARPEDVAAAVRFLASEGARQVNGVCIPVEGGYRWRR